MNILSELLPGARQIRTPLVIGYLWLLVAWINETRVPEALRHGLLISRANHDLRHLSVALVILILSFSAYLTGLFFELLDDIAVKLGAPTAAGLALMILALILFIFAVGLWPITLTTVMVAVGIFYRRARRLQSTISKEMIQWIINASLPIRTLCYVLWNAILRVWSNAYPVRNDLVADSIIKLLNNHPEVSARFCETISVYSLRAACHEAGLRQNKRKSRPLDLNGKMVDVAEVARRSSINSADAELLRSYLSQRMTTSREVGRSVVLRVMHTSDIRHLVDRAIEGATARIQADKPGVFETYDRLRSEGELRRGIAVPFGVALSSACAFYTVKIWIIGCLAIPAVFIYFSGMKKQEEATRIVVNFIAAQITPIKLDVDDVRLLRWQIQEPRYESIIASMRLSKIRAWPKFHNKKKSDEPLNYTDPDSNPADVPDTVKE